MLGDRNSVKLTSLPHTKNTLSGHKNVTRPTNTSRLNISIHSLHCVLHTVLKHVGSFIKTIKNFICSYDLIVGFNGGRVRRNWMVATLRD